MPKQILLPEHVLRLEFAQSPEPFSQTMIWPMCLHLPLTPDDERLLAQRAHSAGQDAAAFALDVLRRELARVARVESMLAPVHEEFERSGMTEEELTGLLERAKHDLRREPRARAS